MTVSEEDRQELHTGLERALGRKQAATMMELLPPVGWADVATKRDLDHLETVLRAEVGTLRTELHGEIGTLRTEMAKLRSDLIAEFVGRLNDAVVSQTRTIVFTMLAYFAGVVALVITLRP